MYIRRFFVFNCYCVWSSFVLRNVNGKSSFLHIKEDVTQGGPLEMIVCGIIILPLIKNIKRDLPEVNQPWYADHTGSLGAFVRIKKYFISLTRQGPGRRYYIKPSKSVLIVHPNNIDAGKEFGARHGSKV